jgi:hypothetical protein
MSHVFKHFSHILISAVLIGSLTIIPASAAGTIGTIHSDTTGRALFSVGETYSFLITPKNPKAKISYTVGNGKLLQTFSSKILRNKDGTKTYILGFKCVSKGETGIYMTDNGKVSRIFSAYVGDTIEQIIDKIQNSNYTVALSGEEAQLLISKGGDKGKQALDLLMKHAKPISGETISK